MSQLDTAEKPILVSTTRAQKKLGVGKTKLFELIRSEDLKSVKIGRKRLIIYASLEALVESGAA